MTKAEQYVLFRANGQATREAAESAEFAAGVPSPQARELWEAYRLARSAPKTTLDHIPDKIDRLREELHDLRILQSAMDLVDI